MKNVILTIVTVVILVSFMFILSGCTLKIEADNNTVSASVDGDTTEKVDSVLDWIKERLSRLFNTDEQ